MLETFDHNFCFLSIGSYSHEHFSVLSITSKFLAFNHSYFYVVKFRLRNAISVETCLNKSACLFWGKNYLHGIVTQIAEDHVIIESPLYLLNLQKHSRVYADTDFPELIQAVLSHYNWKVKHDFDFALKFHYPVSKYTAQYQETDQEFIQRQCSRWGINFCFIQYEEKAIICFFDENSLLSEKFPAIQLDWMTLSRYELHRKALPKTVKINDYNSETPDLDLSMESETGPSDFGKDDRPYEFYQTRELGEVILKRRMEYYDCQREDVFIQTDNLQLSLGQEIVLHQKNYSITALDYGICIIKNERYVNVHLVEKTRSYRPDLPVLFHMPDVTAHIISEHVDEAGRYFISPDYDETKTANTCPVRLSQPCAGNKVGFHFPLVKHTKVLITHINGDPDRPVILGVMPSEVKPHPVTDANKSQHILRTAQGNQVLIEEDPINSSIEFSSQNNLAVLNLLHDEMRCESAYDVLCKIKNSIHTIKNNYSYQTDKNYYTKTGKSYWITTEKGDTAISSGKDLTVSCEEFKFYANKNFIVQSIYTKFHLSHINIQAEQIGLVGQTKSSIEADKLKINSTGKIRLSVEASSISLGSSGIIISAPRVAFNTPSFNAPPPQLGASGESSAQAQLKKSNFNMSYKNLDDRFSHSVIKNNKGVVWAGCVREFNPLEGIEVGEPLEVHHTDLIVIALDKKNQKPNAKFSFTPQQNKTHEVTVLNKPKYKAVQLENGHFECELLSEAELQYFKSQTNNKIIIFIHGYNVPAGHFGQYSYIRTPDEGFADDRINGAGSPNWYLHMEYNLNCAIQENYLEFPWDEKALEYKRILGIHWPGYKKIYDIPWSNNLNFAGMEFNALASGYALLPLIKQLKQAGLEITLIAHSLGCLVAIQLMDLIGREHQTYLERVFLWQAAVANVALSPVVLDSVEQKQLAAKQSAEGSIMAVGAPPLILYEYYGEFLRQKAAKFKHIPPWDLYEKDPFAYFPYAHYATQKMYVLFSEHDDVLKWTYRANAIFANLPHYNFIFNPLGLYGPDEETQKLLKNKLQCVDQSDCLFGHSEMRIPLKRLFEKVYLLIIKEIGRYE